MFDEIIKEIKKTGNNPRILRAIRAGREGYFDRVCPNKKCAGEFKVLFADWKDKVKDEAVFCPFCRHERHWLSGIIPNRSDISGRRQRLKPQSSLVRPLIEGSVERVQSGLVVVSSQ